MPKLIVNWVAWYYDFEGGEVNQEGPSYHLHQSFFRHDLHLLVSSGDEGDPRSELLFTRLKQAFPAHKIELIYATLTDIFDFPHIKKQILSVLQPYKGWEIDVLFSSGTTPMRTAWVLVHLEENGFKTRLIQGIDARMGEGKAHFRPLELDHSIFAGRLVAKHEKEAGSQEGIWITPSLAAVYREAKQVGMAEGVNTLILGENGTGKERLARYVHEQSDRSDKEPLIINCSALGDNLLESRLFGHKKGSFTGALKDQKGLFELAEGSSIILDEIGDVSPYMQQSLLRVVQQGEIMPIGAEKTVKVDVRIIASTNKNLHQLCSEKRFRWDLFYRLSEASLILPPFRDYSLEEKKELIEYFLNKKRHIAKTKTGLLLDQEVWKQLLTYNYPGNIRELENIIANFYVFASEKVTTVDLKRAFVHQPESLQLDLYNLEKRHISKLWEVNGYNITQTARDLGISVNGLKGKLIRYELHKDKEL